MGIISTGCALCRKRRIKCDEGKPGCQRCARIGSVCPGYDRGLRVVLYTDSGDRRKKAAPREQSSDTSAVTDSDRVDTKDFGDGHKQPVAVRKPPRTSKIELQESFRHGSPRAAISPEPKLDIRPNLLRDIEARSVCLFVASFVQDPTSAAEQPAFLDFLPDLHAASADGSCLPQTLKAVALLNFLNRYKATETLTECARYSYGNALRAVNTALSDPKLAVTDQALTSVWLLSMYELLAPGNLSVGQRTPWVSHVNGTLQLLRLRGKQGLSAPMGRLLFRLVQTPIIVMDMMLGNKPSEEIADLNQYMLDLDVEDSYAVFSVSSYIQQVAGIRYRLKDWVETHTTVPPPPQPIDILTLKRTIVEAVNTNSSNAFETWALQRAHWKPAEVEDDENTSLDVPALGMHYFSSMSVMVNWVTMWTTKMLLLQSLMCCLSMLPDASTFGSDGSGGAEQDLTMIDRETLKTSLQTTANSILGCASFAFGDVTRAGKQPPLSTGQSSAYSSSAIGAYHMFWPVGAVLASPYTTPEQKLLAQTALRSIGERFCIVQALKYAEL